MCAKVCEGSVIAQLKLTDNGRDGLARKNPVILCIFSRGSCPRCDAHSMDAAQLRPLMALRVSSGSQAATSSVAAPQRGRSRQPGRSRGSSQLAARATQRPGESQSGVFGQITDKQRAGGCVLSLEGPNSSPTGGALQPPCGVARPGPST